MATSEYVPPCDSYCFYARRRLNRGEDGLGFNNLLLVEQLQKGVPPDEVSKVFECLLPCIWNQQGSIERFDGTFNQVNGRRDHLGETNAQI